MQHVEEKIQKAREIYYSRNGIKFRGEKEKKRYSGTGWIIVLLIIVAIYGYQYKDFLKSDGFKNRVQEFLNTPVNFKSIRNFFSTPQKEKPEENNQKQVKENTEASNNDIEKAVESAEILSIIWPFNGTVTSGFGPRESNDERVSGNHTGIDIAGNERR